MSDWVTGVATGLIASGIGFATRTYYLYLKRRRGPLSGTWRQVIDEGYRRVDAVVCSHSSNGALKGEIKRIVPESEAHKAWRFRGRKKGDFIFMTFWNLDDSQNPESSGTIQLHEHNPKHLEGFYVKSMLKPHAKKKDALLRELDITHLTWEKE